MIEKLHPSPTRRPRPIDAVVAAGLFACSFPGSLIALPGQDLRVTWWPGVLLAGVSCLASMWRHARPRTTAVVTLLCAAAASALGYLLTVLLLGPIMVALYSLAVGTDRKTANTFAAGGIALLVGMGLFTGPAGEPIVLKLLGPAAWLLLPTSLGTVTRLRSACLEAVQARAEHAERTREQEGRRRVAEERMRIARDLHDVVAHHLVLANLQAGAVVRQLPRCPDEASRIARELSGTTASAVRELKSTVGLLRAAGDADKPVEPTPGLAQLPELSASFENAGLVVTVTTEGEPEPLSAGTDVTAYRIVQEALTNVTKHATVRAAEVRLAYSPDRLAVTVVNDGRPGSATPPGSGYGVMGMRERARSVGGRIRVGPRERGGFEVVAELPLGTP